MKIPLPGSGSICNTRGCCKTKVAQQPIFIKVSEEEYFEEKIFKEVVSKVLRKLVCSPWHE